MPRSAIEFIGGPCKGIHNIEPPAVHRRNIALPVNDTLVQVTSPDEALGYAIYEWRVTDRKCFFRFVQSKDGKTIFIRFVDGPLEGPQPFPVPIEGCPQFIHFPLREDGKPLNPGEPPAKVAIYQKNGPAGDQHFIFQGFQGEPRKPVVSDQVSTTDERNALWQFTADELVAELASRTTFGGVIVYLPDGIRQFPVESGTDVAIAFGTQFDKSSANQLLTLALKHLQ